MWKFMVFGLIVQMVIFMSLLDVYVYESVTRHCGRRVKQCPKKIVMFVVEGLQIGDLNETVGRTGLFGHAIQDHHIHTVVDTPASLRVRPHRNNESVFGDQAILYLGPELDTEHYSGSHWKTVYFVDLPQNVTDDLSRAVLPANGSKHFSSYMMPAFLGADTKSYPIILMRYQTPDYLSESETSSQVLQSYLTEISYILDIPPILDENNIYVLSSSMDIFTHNSSYPGPRNDSVLVVWSKQCSLPTVNSTLDYFGAFEWMNYLVSRTDESFEVQEEELRDVFPDFYVEGNLLDVIILGHGDSRKHKTSSSQHLNALEAMNVMLYSMNYMEVEYESVTKIATMLLTIPWVLLLCVKALKSVVPSMNGDAPTNKTALLFLDSACFGVLAIIWILGNYWVWDFRYYLFHFVGIIVLRLLCEELMSLSLSTERISVPNKLKIAFQVILFAGIVEGLFWTTTCTRLLYVLFISVVAAKIFQGAFSTTNFKIVVTLAVAAVSVGVIYLSPVTRLPYLITLNITICLWIMSGFFAIKCLMTESIHDRFLMFLCLIEFLMASIFANLFVFQNDASMAIILSFFSFLSAILPLLGGTDVKCRVIALSVTTASLFLFFACHGEGLTLLALFISCFCSFLMDKSSSDRQSEAFNYFCIFPVLFYTVTIVTTCELIMPIGSSSLFPSTVLVDIGASYDFKSFGLVYFLKLSFLLTLFVGTALSSSRKSVELAYFLLIIVILNLVSFRTYLQLLLLPGRLYRIGKTRMFMKHILMQTMATVMFYLYPFIQMMTKGSIFTLCQTLKNIGLEPIKQ